MYTRIPQDEYRVTAFRFEIRVRPDLLREALGEPDEGTGYKTAREYRFEDGEGNTITIYDYKATAGYDEELPTGDELWASREPVELHIGSDSPPAAFRFLEWLQSKIPGIEVTRSAHAMNKRRSS